MIKVFISSTFSDMQAERDILLKRVLPNVRQFARTKGQDVCFVDLRWGISNEELTSTEATSKILSVCMQEIDSCQPYFVLLLGDRYGTLPNLDALKDFLAKNHTLDFLQAENKSITELETLYALSNKIVTPKIIACIRENNFLKDVQQELKPLYVEKENKDLLLNFKNSINNDKNVKVISYSPSWDSNAKRVCNLHDLEKKLTLELIEQISLNLGTEPPSLEKDALLFDTSILNKYSSTFVNRTEYTNEIISFTKSPNNVLILTGDTGNGKTCLIAQASKLLTSQDNVVITLFLGNGFYNATIENVLINIIYRLNQFCLSPIPLQQDYPLDKLKSIAKNIITDISKTKKVIILIDNLSALLTEECKEFFSYIPLNKDNYKLIVSTNSVNTLNLNALITQPWQELSVLGLNQTELTSVVDALLREEGKELDKNSLQEFYNACLFRSPLYISLAIKRLMILSQADFNNINKLSKELNVDGGEAISKYLTQLIKNLPYSEEELASLLIEHTAEEFDIKNYKELINLIVISNEQLRAQDVVEILNANSKDKTTLFNVVGFVRYLDEILTINSFNNRIQLAHPIVKKQTESLSVDETLNLYNAVFEYIDQLDNSEPIKQKLYLLFALYTNNFFKAVQFLHTVHTTNIKNAYTELQNAFSFPQNRDFLINQLNMLPKVALDISKDCLNIISQEFIGKIFLIINKVSRGGGLELELLKPLYDIAFANLYQKNYFNIYNRTVYMIAEKCLICSTNLEQKEKYSDIFIDQSYNLLKHANENYEHLDYIVSDLGYAYEKKADVLQALNDINQADKHYLFAIDAVSLNVKTSTNKLDLLQYQKHLFIYQRYKMLVDNFIYDKKTTFNLKGLLNSIKTNYKTLPTELLSVIDFCNRAVKNFVQEERSMSLTSYITLLADSNFTLASYYSLFDKHTKQAEFLTNALQASLLLYQYCDDLIAYDKIRLVELNLGYNPTISEKERLVYLKSANKKTKELLKADLNQNQIEAFNSVLDTINGEMVKIYFCILHDKINVNSKEFTLNFKNDFLKNQTQISNKNFRFFTETCLEYLQETNLSAMPCSINLNEREELILKKVNVLMQTTIATLINYSCTHLKKVYSLIKPDLKLLDQTLFKQTANENQDIILIAKLFAEKNLNEYNNTFFISEFLDLLKISKTAYHNLYLVSCDLHEKENKEFWYNKELIAKSDYSFFKNLDRLYKGTDNEYIEPHSHYFVQVIADLKLFAFCIKKGDKLLKDYIQIATTKSKYWYTLYTALKQQKDFCLQEEFDIVGKYICSTIDDVSTKRICYYSNFYECVALEYAYKHNLKLIAHKIVDDGYDYYLEFETLYLLRKYDKQRYITKINQLKEVCLLKRIKEIKHGYFTSKTYIQELYGNIFCTEFLNLATISLNNIDYSNPKNPRLNPTKIKPSWA